MNQYQTRNEQPIVRLSRTNFSQFFPRFVSRVLLLSVVYVSLPGCVVITLSDDGKVQRIPAGEVIAHPEILLGFPVEEPQIAANTKTGEQK